MPHRRQSNSESDGQSTPVGPMSRPPSLGRGGADGGSSASGIDWSEAVRRLERKRRSLERLPPGTNGGSNGTGVLPLPDDYYVRATWSSFRLDGMDVSETQVRDALAQTSGGNALRSRQSQRLRNHAAILHHIETDLRQGTALTTDVVIRWYTGIGAGLCTSSLNESATGRLEERVRRINSPQLRLGASVPEVAAVHVGLLADPLVPSFNGILARLLLRYHLGRCHLPAVLFDPSIDGKVTTPDAMARRLVELLETTCDQILARP